MAATKDWIMVNTMREVGVIVAKILAIMTVDQAVIVLIVTDNPIATSTTAMTPEAINLAATVKIAIEVQAVIVEVAETGATQTATFRTADLTATEINILSMTDLLIFLNTRSSPV